MVSGSFLESTRILSISRTCQNTLAGRGIAQLYHFSNKSLDFEFHVQFTVGIYSRMYHRRLNKLDNED